MTRHAHSPIASLLVVLWLLTGLPASAHPQESAAYSDPPAHVAFVDGRAFLERDGRTDDAPLNMPVLAGDRLRTDSGRVEVMFADAATLHLDVNTVVDFQSDTLLRLLQGRVRLSIPGQRRQVDYRIDSPAGTAVILDTGEYRVALTPRGDAVDLAVIRGAAELVNDRGRRELRAGERSFARAGEAPSYPYVFNSAWWDDFDRWSETRRDARMALSSRYLPEELGVYGAAFDQYGSWRYDTTYGHVWYPVVSAGWRPYYYGRWAPLRPYGWTWIGADAWAWPTHHYGRWGISAGAWFWIPGRHWAPAWVSWAYAPGYVSWCPLGWNNYPVVQFVNVHVHRGYNPWHAWTVMPRHHFGTGYVNAHVVHGATIDARVRGSFVRRDVPPDLSGYAVARASAPIRTAGAAVPRYSAPATRQPASGSRPVVDPPAAGRESRQPSPGRVSAETRAPALREPGDASRSTSPVGPDPAFRSRTSGAGDTGRGATAVRRPPSTSIPYGRGTDSVPANGVRERAREVVPPAYGVPDSQPSGRAVQRYEPRYDVPSRRIQSDGPGSERGANADRQVVQPRLPPVMQQRPTPRAPSYEPPVSRPSPSESRGPAQAVPRAAPREERTAPPPYSRAPRSDSSAGQGGGVQRAAPRDSAPQRSAPAGRPGGGRGR